jgi:Tfp pilus assembly protein PilF
MRRSQIQGTLALSALLLPIGCIGKFDQAPKMDAPTLAASHQLALTYDREGKDQQALAEYQRCLKEQPKDAEILNDFGVFYYDRGRWKDAEELFRKAVQCDTQNQRACVNLGRVLGQEERYKESYVAFARVLRPAEAHHNVAVLMAHNGKTDQARQEIKEALLLDPSLQRAQLVQATLNRAE